MGNRKLNSVELVPIKIPRKNKPFDLFNTIKNISLRVLDGDILIISSKFVSMSEGALVHLRDVTPSHRAKNLASQFRMDEKFVEVVLKESDCIVSGIPGFLLSIHDGILAPNAGIDKSNVPPGTVIIYPRNPYGSAEKLRKQFLGELNLNVGIVISDSRLMPLRIGTIGVAIGVAGLEPVEDDRGRKDLFGKRLRFTYRSVADSLATMGVALMGESNESIPIVIARGFKVTFSRRLLSSRDMTVSYSNDLYFSSNLLIKATNTKNTEF
jgi:coenzyme F420-0:L-glutamate ligase